MSLKLASKEKMHEKIKSIEDWFELHSHKIA